MKEYRSVFMLFVRGSFFALLWILFLLFLAQTGLFKKAMADSLPF